MRVFELVQYPPQEGCMKRSNAVSSTDRMIRLLTGFLLMLLSLLCMPSLSAAVEKVYTLAIVPQFPPSTIKHDWGPLVERLSHDAGLKLELKFYKSIPDFEEDFLKGGPDFVYLNPYHAIMANKAQGYIPLVRDSVNRLIGILVVRKDSPFRRVKDLDGTVLAFPSPNAFAASLYMRALLVNREKVTFEPKYVGTHCNVYRHVILGLPAAGGGINKTFAKETSELRNELRIIYRTPPVASHPLCAHPRVPAQVRETVTRAVLNLARDKLARALLKTVEIARPIRADYKNDYLPLEKLDLEKFEVKDGD